jgi:hypothetical protein
MLRGLQLTGCVTFGETDDQRTGLLFAVAGATT